MPRNSDPPRQYRVGHHSRRPMSMEDVARLFKCIESWIRDATNARSDHLPELLRDQCLIRTSYELAARVSEVISLDVGDSNLTANSRTLGSERHVMTCSVLKRRVRSPSTRIKFIVPRSCAQVIQSYLAEGRPQLAKRGRSCEQALFLSDWGRRITERDVRAILARWWTVAKLEAKDFSAYQLRGSRMAHGVGRD